MVPDFLLGLVIAVTGAMGAWADGAPLSETWPRGAITSTSQAGSQSLVRLNPTALTGDVSNGHDRLTEVRTPPAVEQIRVKGDALQIELSEELLESALEQAVTARTLKLYNPTKDQLVGIEVMRPVLTGRQARRRLVMSSVDPPESEGSTWPEAGDLVQLVIPVSALEDAFDNVANEGYTKSFSWPAVDEVVEDQAAPRLDRICVTTEGRIEIELTEEVSTHSAGMEIEIAGGTVTWTADPDGYVLRSQDPLEPGSYRVTIGTGSLDLSGKGLDVGYSEAFTVTPATEAVVYSAPFPGLVAVSTVGNDFGYHGLRHDSETGFVYVRQRYYDPQLGRFISTDPYGYVDSPNLYQFALNNPSDFSDPTGEFTPDTAFDLASLAVGSVSFRHNVNEGNFWEASIDSVGIVVDMIALALPVPGGAGVALKILRWSVDNATHGGSKFKVFREYKKGLGWIEDADEYGDYIRDKHKGPTGLFIPWGHLGKRRSND